MWYHSVEAGADSYIRVQEWVPEATKALVGYELEINEVLPSKVEIDPDARKIIVNPLGMLVVEYLAAVFVAIGVALFGANVAPVTPITPGHMHHSSHVPALRAATVLPLMRRQAGADQSTPA